MTLDFPQPTMILLNDVDLEPALMIYGTGELVARNERIIDSVPNVTEVELDCGHWISEENAGRNNASDPQLASVKRFAFRGRRGS